MKCRLHPWIPKAVNFLSRGHKSHAALGSTHVDISSLSTTLRGHAINFSSPRSTVRNDAWYSEYRLVAVTE